MKALLVRVGIDSGQENGNWNAPMNPNTNEFAYVPILESPSNQIELEYRTGYEEFFEPCERLGKPLDKEFASETSHVDPDFSELTYGDIDETDGRNHRGKPLLKLEENDLLVFFAGLDPGRYDAQVELVQAIIGLYVIKEKPMRATDIPNIDSIRHKNAHTRRTPEKKDIIVFAKPAPLSGRLERCIPISERRSNNNYYLKQNLFEEWGGFLDRYDIPVKEIRLQRTPLFRFKNADKFYYGWFRNQNKNNRLVEFNNLLSIGG